MFKKMTDSLRWRFLTPVLLLVASALLAANMLFSGSAVWAGGDDGGAGPAGPYHEHWLCVNSGGFTQLTFVHVTDSTPPAGLCNGEAFVVAVRDNGHPLR